MRELGYSTGAAWRRLKAMRLCEEVKGARGRLLEGTLTLDAAAQLQYAFEQQERKARRSTTPDTDQHAGSGTQAATGSATSVMEPGARAAVAPGGLAPDVAARAAGPEGSAGAPIGLVPDAPVRAPERPATPVPDAAERESLVAQAAGKSTRRAREMLAKVDPDLARAADRVRPLGAGRWELKAVIDDDLPGRAAAAAGIATSAPKAGGRSQPAAHRADRLATPAAVRRQVWERDRGCCSFAPR